MRGRRAAAIAGLALLLLGGAVSGCGTGSDPSRPTGVDGLTIPTPSVDPADFVTGIDNTFLPLKVGAAWEYAVTGSRSGTATVTTHEGPDVAGVATTAVRTTLVLDRGGRTVATDFYAQDQLGNVWWFGREGLWLAGADGAEAGLVMAAAPRVGDGYRQALAPGLVDLRANVLSIDDSLSVPDGDYDDLVTLEVTSLTGSVQRASYAAGVGLVHLESVEGQPEMRLGLAAHDEP